MDLDRQIVDRRFACDQFTNINEVIRRLTDFYSSYEWKEIPQVWGNSYNDLVAEGKSYETPKEYRDRLKGELEKNKTIVQEIETKLKGL